MGHLHIPNTKQWLTRIPNVVRNLWQKAPIGTPLGTMMIEETQNEIIMSLKLSDAVLMMKKTGEHICKKYKVKISLRSNGILNKNALINKDVVTFQFKSSNGQRSVNQFNLIKSF